MMGLLKNFMSFLSTPRLSRWHRMPQVACAAFTTYQLQDSYLLGVIALTPFASLLRKRFQDQNGTPSVFIIIIEDEVEEEID